MAIPKKGMWEIKDGPDCSALALRAQHKKAGELAALAGPATGKERAAVDHPSHRRRSYAVLNPRN